jgi:guanylate kinase
LDVIRQRLEKRGTETPKTLEERITKAAHELTFASKFNCIIINDDIDVAARELTEVVNGFIRK